MPHKKRDWLQIKGDRAIRENLFRQTRIQSIFDDRADELLNIVYTLLCEKDTFHVKVHWSSNQLTVWNYTNPYDYGVYVGEEVFHPEFLSGFSPSENFQLSVLSKEQIGELLECFKKLRFQDPQLYIRISSIHVLNGRIGLTFSCDGSHYVYFDKFKEHVHKLFVANEVQVCV